MYITDTCETTIFFLKLQIKNKFNLPLFFSYIVMLIHWRGTIWGKEDILIVSRNRVALLEREKKRGRGWELFCWERISMQVVVMCEGADCLRETQVEFWESFQPSPRRSPQPVWIIYTIPTIQLPLFTRLGWPSESRIISQGRRTCVKTTG